MADKEFRKVVQRHPGRVKPTKRLPGTPLRDDGGLEAEADAMGARAAAGGPVEKPA